MRQTVYFGPLYHGKAEDGRDYYLYTTLWDSETHNLIISAGIEYVLKAIKERNYYVVPKPI